MQDCKFCQKMVSPIRSAKFFADDKRFRLHLELERLHQPVHLSLIHSETLEDFHSQKDCVCLGRFSIPDYLGN